MKVAAVVFGLFGVAFATAVIDRWGKGRKAIRRRIAEIAATGTDPRPAQLLDRGSFHTPGINQ